jgi:hypothetical protein
MMPPGIGQVEGIAGKASDLDHRYSDQIDHSNPELNPCCFVMYFKYYQTGL